MHERGFTLVEIIIALTILALLFTVVSYIQAKGAAGYAVTRQQVEVQESLRIALSKMSTELKTASASTISITSNGRKISFKTSAGPSGFRLDSNARELEKYYDGKYSGVWQPFASNIEDVFFQYDPELAFIDITVKGENGVSGVKEMKTGISLRVR